MLSLVTREDRLAIFQKLTPVSFSRLFRTCKWANQFIQDNKSEIKIHVDRDLFFSSKYNNSNNAWRNCIEIISLRQSMTISYELAELESILSDARFQCFIFESVYVHKPVSSHYFPAFDQSDLAEYPTILEQVATIATRKLTFYIYEGVRLPTFRYTYESLQIKNYRTPTLEATFDLAETQRNVRLEFDTVDLPVDGIVGRCCELMRKIVEGRVATKKLAVALKQRMEQPTVLDRFFHESRRETVVLAEGADFHFIPVTQRSFLAAQWRSYDRNSAFIIELIENMETFHKNVIMEYKKCPRYEPNTLTDDEILILPVVQQISNRFFS